MKRNTVLGIVCDEETAAGARPPLAGGAQSPRAAGGRLSGTETLMWLAEADPLLRWSFLTVSRLDRPLDRGAADLAPAEGDE